MCGIVGMASTRGHDPGELERTIRRMGFMQYHRGPDGWGEWLSSTAALGHNRLAILDLEHGRQPMASDDGAATVVFNGEIYNFRALWRELESKGHRFRTDHSDTEVIVNGYREWGVGVFERLEGMFAIGLWDAIERCLVLARDGVGIKPLFMAHAGETLAFASELKALIASGWVEPRIAEESLLDYFMFRGARGSATLVRGITKVPAGTWIRFDTTDGNVTSRRFWTPSTEPGAGIAKPADGAVSAVVESAVSSHLVADVPVGVFLSGGVDSSLISALASREQQIDAFAIGTHSPLDESRYAREVADHLGISLHVRWVQGNDFRDRFEDWSYFNDDPVSDPSALALMLLSEHARSHGMKVMLAGEGADELFGGYPTYQIVTAFNRLAKLGRVGANVARRGPRRGGLRMLDDYAAQLPGVRFFGSSHVLTSEDRRSLLSDVPGADIDEWERQAFCEIDDRRPARRAMVFDQMTRLPDDLLARTDRATMAYSLEARVPYLDRNVVEVANRLADSECVSLAPPRTKMLLKRLAAANVPSSAVYRKKRGFNLPVEGWLVDDFREIVEGFLETRRIAALNYGYLASVYDAHVAGTHRGALLWAWLVLEQWHRVWMDGHPPTLEPPVIVDRPSYDLLRGSLAARV